MSRSTLALVLGMLMFSSALVAGYEVRGTDSRKPGKAHARSSDAELEGNVKSALHARIGAPAADIEVAVQDGFVFLYGEVRSEKLRVRAERIVARVAGVRAVSNELVPAPSG